MRWIRSRRHRGARGEADGGSHKGVRCPYCGGELSAVIRRSVDDGKGFCPEHGVVEPRPESGGGVGAER
ncbi:MAG: hypothetical protein M3N68_11535 [Actinomycetota bacterium]|nr:hypothetical protein [Actinomycetota bacterium]